MDFILRYFWFVFILMVIANGVGLRHELHKRAGANTAAADEGMEVISHLFVWPLTALSLTLGVLQVLARSPSPMAFFCARPLHGYALVSAALLACWSVFSFVYAWTPGNASRLRLLMELWGSRPNVWLIRAIILVSQGSFWAIMLLAPGPCQG
jgi:hypothetical protein